MNNKICMVIAFIIALLCSSLVLASCGFPDFFSKNQPSVDSEKPQPSVDSEKPQPSVIDEEIRESSVVIATAVSTDNDKLQILDSCYDGDKHYYLLYAGHVKNAYLATLLSVEYNGHPVCVEKTIGKKVSVAEELSKTVSSAYTVSHDLQVQIGIREGIEASAEASAGSTLKAKLSSTFSYEFNTAWGATTTSQNGKSTTNTKSTVEERSETEKCSYNFGANANYPHGTYRYAMYSTCDVYFEVITSKENDELKSFTTISCVREDSIVIASQYSSDGRFINKIENPLVIADDFYKYLDKPQRNINELELKDPVGQFPKTMNLSPTINTSMKVSDDSQNKYYIFDLKDLKETISKYNLEIVKIQISIDIKEINEGYQELYLTNQSSPQWRWKNYTHVFDEQDVIYMKSDITTPHGSQNFVYDIKLSKKLSINDLCDYFYLFLGANGKNEDDWTASNAKLKVYLAQLGSL